MFVRFLRPSCFKPSTSIASFTTSAGLRRSQPGKEIRFSETAAYQGLDRRQFDLNKSTWQPDYYTTDSYRNKKLLSALLSLGLVILWFGWLREPSDLDDILNAPPHVISSNLERRMIRDQIEHAKKAGKDTTLLEAELQYVDVKEAALKAQFSKKKL